MLSRLNHDFDYFNKPHIVFLTCTILGFREHEMAANLLSRLYHEVIQADQMQKGFKRLLASVDDLKLDVPAAEEDLALFLARAVVDDILPPAFLQKVPCGTALHSAVMPIASLRGCGGASKAYITDLP